MKAIWSKLVSIMSKKKNPYVKGLENKIARLEEAIAQTKALENQKPNELATVEYVRMVENMDPIDGFAVLFNEDTKQYEFMQITAIDYKIVYKKNIGDAKHRAHFELNKMLAHGELLPKEK